VPQREDFEARKPGARIGQVFALFAGDFGDRAQHDCGRYRQLDGQSAEAEGAAYRSRSRGQRRMQDPAADEPPVAEAEQGNVERPRQRGLGRLGNHRRRRGRQRSRHQFRRPSGERRHPAGESRLLEVLDRRCQRSTIHVRKIHD
jgi:hypothetical protein